MRGGDRGREEIFERNPEGVNEKRFRSKRKKTGQDKLQDLSLNLQARFPPDIVEVHC